jgi:putative flippase GtrA
MGRGRTEAVVTLSGRLSALFQWAWQSWATRSLAIGGVATLLDLAAFITCGALWSMANPIRAMIGVTLGSIFTFFANRQIAFRDHTPKLAPQALKFALATTGSMFIHAMFVWFLADRLGVQPVLAKLLSDIAVFSVGQLLLLRYIVFPKASGSLEPQLVAVRPSEPVS